MLLPVRAVTILFIGEFVTVARLCASAPLRPHPALYEERVSTVERVLFQDDISGAIHWKLNLPLEIQKTIVIFPEPILLL